MRLILASSDLTFDRTMLTGESNLIVGTTDVSIGDDYEAHNMALQGKFAGLCWVSIEQKLIHNSVL